MADSISAGVSKLIITNLTELAKWLAEHRAKPPQQPPVLKVTLEFAAYQPDHVTMRIEVEGTTRPAQVRFEEIPDSMLANFPGRDFVGEFIVPRALLEIKT